jgi:hypothetical protein
VSKADIELEGEGQVHPNRMCHLVLGNTVDRHMVGQWAASKSDLSAGTLWPETMRRAVAGAVRLKRWMGEKGEPTARSFGLSPKEKASTAPHSADNPTA